MNVSLLFALMLLGTQPDTPIEAKLLRVTQLGAFSRRERRFGKTSEQILSAHPDPMPG